ncbi:MAG TPA: EcsC family protein [Candidatus Acidoferrales bacterium]|jgi:hypothetical protein|nr:EcsC family protein [Candidatus Acidoferrales bacterium]
MAKYEESAVSRLFQSAVRMGFRQAYPRVEVNPEKYLENVRNLYGLPLETWKDAHRLDERVLAPVSARIITSSARMAALEGMGFGVGGLATVLPDMGVLAAITLRMLQKLSLVHGFEYSTAEEVTALWLAAASAAGMDLAREFVEKQAVEKLVPRIIDAMAVKVGAEVAEKWAARVVPLLSAGAAATLNYYFVRAWGRRAENHFLEKHRAARKILTTVPLPALRSAATAG